MDEIIPLGDDISGPNTHILEQDFDRIAEVYRLAFAGYPWNEQSTNEEVRERLEDYMAKPGFTAFIEHDEAGEPIGGLWYDTPTLETLEIQKGKTLHDFADAAIKGAGVSTIAYEREVFTHPGAQGKGIGTQLRARFLTYLSRTHPEGTLVLTRMRSDNYGIIRIAEKAGYVRTDIGSPVRQVPEIFNEYWYRLVD